MNKRFIEESFPVKIVSEESAREKSIRHGHISTLHIWWARRPLASSRTTNYAALIKNSKNMDEWNKKRIFIGDLSKWENSLNANLINRARQDIFNAFNGRKPVILDPFSGGGAIPLEALRLGCETYASDYNPVAVLIEKCTLEYPQKYGKKLVEDVEKWGKWVLEIATNEIGKFYPFEFGKKETFFGESIEKNIPIGYIWTRTIRCQNLSCEAEIPLIRQFWLAKKSNKKISLYPYIENRKIRFKIVGDGNEDIPTNFDPNEATISRGVAKCLVCGSSIAARDVRKQFHQGKAGQRMIAVVYYQEGKKGKKYRVITDEDFKVYQEAEKYLEKRSFELEKEWGISPVPDEEIPLMSGTFNVPIYGMNKWGDLFNSRQKLSLITFTEKIRAAYQQMLQEGYEKEYAKVITVYLALVHDRLTDKNATLVVYNVVGEKIEHVFGRQALPMTWDYVELNVFSGVNGDWISNLNWVQRVLEHLVYSSDYPATVTRASATELPYEDNFFDAVFTDPPYYNSVPYADLSDYFYVWLKRSIGDLYPSFFVPRSTPKTKEIVEMASWDEKRYSHKTKEYFENNLKKAFQEINRVLKPDGIVIIVYAHKTTEGWETVINALLDSGLTVTASWPLSTERTARLRARDSATLTSSIYIVAKKKPRKENGFYPEVKKLLKSYLTEKLERLWEEGISGVDFFIAAIGAGIEIFGEYEKIMDYEGNIIRADILLEDIRKIATDFAVKQIVHNGFSAEITQLTRFYVLWRWNFQEAKVPFDDAKKLAQSAGIDLEKEWNKGFISKTKEYIRVIGPKDRDTKDIAMSNELIDVLHHVLLLWEKNKREEIISRLSQTYGKSEMFYRIAQAISQTLSDESKEKKLLDGFLSGKEKIKKEMVEGLGKWFG
ncbi:MAG: DUF1156 domain-containing protein [Candidatus Odinarchaeota archaeon]